VKWRAIALLVAAHSGCRTHLLDEADAGVDMTVCASNHYLDVVPLLDITLVDPQGALAWNRTVRVKATFPVHPDCDVPGALDQSEQADGTIALTAHVWRAPDWTHCAAPRPVERIAVVPPGSCPAGRMAIVDGAPGGLARLSVAFSCEPFLCAPQPGGACTSDCDCLRAGGQGCIPTAPGLGVCAVPCDRDTDCRSPTGVGTLNACSGKVAFTCSDAPGCATDGDCPFGQRCTIPNGGTERACRPVLTVTRGAPCHCDAECGFGGICSVNVDLGYCVIPCTTAYDCFDFQDCQDSQCMGP
jgi:hypothetical protein